MIKTFANNNVNYYIPSCTTCKWFIPNINEDYGKCKIFGEKTQVHKKKVYPFKYKNQGKEVNALTMEAYSPMAVKQIERLVSEAGDQWPIIKTVVCHRTGPLEIGDIAVIIGVTCVHRAEAFAACQWLIDTLKKEVPIWKNEFYADGSSWLVPHP
jgi:molybdopterin synthase catalytic subunit